MAFECRPGRAERRAFQEEGTASAKALRWPILVTAKRPVGLEPRAKERMVMGARWTIMGPFKFLFQSLNVYNTLGTVSASVCFYYLF